MFLLARGVLVIRVTMLETEQAAVAGDERGRMIASSNPGYVALSSLIIGFLGDNSSSVGLWTQNQSQPHIDHKSAIGRAWG